MVGTRLGIPLAGSRVVVFPALINSCKGFSCGVQIDSRRELGNLQTLGCRLLMLFVALKLNDGVSS